MENKRVAICIGGHIRVNSIDNMKKFILDILEANGYTIDIFISTWRDEGFRGKSWCKDGSISIDDVIHTFNPKDISIESLDNDFFIKKYCSNQWREQNTGNDTLGDASSMWYKLWRCKNIMCSYAKTYNICYDAVLRIRPDIIYNTYLNIDDLLNSIKTKSVYMPTWHGKCKDVTQEIMDHYFFGDFENMSKIFDIFPHILDDMKDTTVIKTAEGLLYNCVQKHQINLIRFNIKYSVQRHNRIENVF